MLDSATILIGPSSAYVPEVEEIIERWLRTYSTGYLLLPEGESDPVKSCDRMKGLKVVKWNTSGDLEKKLQKIYLTDKSIVVVAVELEIDSITSEFIDRQLDDSLVSPSALYLNGSRVSLNRSVCWKMFKYQCGLTRHGSEDGLVQWGHLLNELSFCLGHSPKYGD